VETASPAEIPRRFCVDGLKYEFSGLHQSGSVYLNEYSQIVVDRVQGVI
jgi:hypothetical protein